MTMTLNYNKNYRPGHSSLGDQRLW